jgi:hypothetical protein
VVVAVVVELGSRPVHHLTERGLADACSERSALAGDGDVERVADLTHPFVAESADALDERPNRHALD